MAAIGKADGGVEAQSLDHALTKIAAELGRLSARTLVLEAFAEQRLDASPLNSPSTVLLDRFYAPVAQLRLEGEAHDLERFNDRVQIRWTASEWIALTVPIKRDRPKALRIWFASIIRERYLKELKVVVNGTVSPFIVGKKGDLHYLQIELLPTSVTCETRVELQLPGVHRPSEGGSSEDARTLGIALAAVECTGNRMKRLLMRVRTMAGSRS